MCDQPSSWTVVGGGLTVEVNEEVLRRCADGDGTSPLEIVVFVRRGLLLTLL